MKKRLKKLILLGVFTTGVIYALNKFIEHSAERKNLIDANKGQFYKWKYGSVFYTKKGDGSPILLIHDLNPISSGYEWSRMVRFLSKDHTVYTIDLLGCGRSDKPAITYTSYLYVNFLQDFIKEIIQEKTTIVASGLSVTFTLAAANLFPDWITKTIIVNPAPLSEAAKTPTDRTKLVKFLMELPILGTYIYNIETGEKNITRLFKERYFLKQTGILEESKDVYFEAAHKNHAGGKYLLSSIRGYYMNTNLKLPLKNIEHLCFIGSRERSHSVAIIDEYANFNKHIETAYVSGSKYLPQLEAPAKLYESLKLFL